MDHVILTVGRNELPVLVAAYRLCALNPRLPRFSVLHSQQTAPEAARVREALERRLTAEGRISTENRLDWVAGDSERVDESYPPSIQLAVRKIVAAAPVARKPDYSFHLHHTGGTTAMGVYALQELLRSQYQPGTADPKYQVESSYLAGRDHLLRDHGGAILTPPGTDERHHWNLPVEDLAPLHGYKATCRQEPAPGLIEASVRMSQIVVDPTHGEGYDTWLGRVWKPQRHQQVAWVDLRAPGWAEITAGIAANLHPERAWLSHASGRWTANPAALGKNEYRHVDQFLHHQFLELLTVRQLRLALTHLTCGTTIVRHSMTAMQPGKTGHEVDVVAVCGYQLLVISCTFSSEFAKLKAFEVIHRARQVGGSHARAIIICNQTAEKARKITDELKDDVASPEYHVEVWGHDVIQNPDEMRDRFMRYLLEKMSWGTETDS